METLEARRARGADGLKLGIGMDRMDPPHNLALGHNKLNKHTT
jgi:hypothetical protein